MGVNITTIDYLRVLIIEIGSTIILMVVEAQGMYVYIYNKFIAEPFRPRFFRRFDQPTPLLRSWKWVGDINALFGGDGVTWKPKTWSVSFLEGSQDDAPTWDGCPKLNRGFKWLGSMGYNLQNR